MEMGQLDRQVPLEKVAVHRPVGCFAKQIEQFHPIPLRSPTAIKIVMEEKSPTNHQKITE
jgi:hypothetical protein